MKMSRQGSWKPRCVILLSTQTAESAAAEPPVALVALSTAWCYTHTEVEWRLCAHTHEAPGLVGSWACYQSAGGLRRELFYWTTYEPVKERMVTGLFLVKNMRRKSGTKTILLLMNMQKEVLVKKLNLCPPKKSLNLYKRQTNKSVL